VPRKLKRFQFLNHYEGPLRSSIYAYRTRQHQHPTSASGLPEPYHHARRRLPSPHGPPERPVLRVASPHRSPPPPIRQSAQSAAPSLLLLPLLFRRKPGGVIAPGASLLPTLDVPLLEHAPEPPFRLHTPGYSSTRTLPFTRLGITISQTPSKRCHRDRELKMSSYLEPGRSTSARYALLASRIFPCAHSVPPDPLRFRLVPGSAAINVLLTKPKPPMAPVELLEYLRISTAQLSFQMRNLPGGAGWRAEGAALATNRYSTYVVSRSACAQGLFLFVLCIVTTPWLYQAHFCFILWKYSDLTGGVADSSRKSCARII